MAIRNKPNVIRDPLAVGSRALRLVTCLLVLLAVQPLPATLSAEPLRLVRGPYLQSVTTDTALVCWGGSAAQTGAVDYGPTVSYDSVATTVQGAVDQCVRLAGLAANTRYHYRVRAEGAPPTADASFKTAAGPEMGSIAFVAWGDNRTNHPIHRRLAGMVKDSGPDFVLNVGDLVEDGTRMGDWDAFFDIERELMANSPVYPAIGNHELNSPLYFSLFALPGNERWYSFDSGPAHFVVMDVVFSRFDPGSEQYAWLERDLRESTRPWKIATFHYPAYAYSPFRSNVEAVRANLAPLFEKYGVQLAFSGDVSSRPAVRDIRFFYRPLNQRRYLGG